MDRMDEDDGYELSTIGLKKLGLKFWVGFITNYRGKYMRPRARLHFPRSREYYSFYLTDPIRWCGESPRRVTARDIRILQKYINRNLPVILAHWDGETSTEGLIDGLKR